MKKCKSEIEKEVIRMYQDGLSMLKIGKSIGKSAATVYRVLKRNNITSRTNGGIYQLDEQDIINQYRNGKSCQKIADKYQVSFGTIRNVLAKHNIKRNNRYHNLTLNTSYWSIINSYDKAYFLGLMIADGNVYKNQVRLVLKKSDKRIIEIFSNKIGNKNKLYVDNRGNGMVGCEVKCSTWVKDLLNHNVYERKTYTTAIPNTIKDEFIPHFIRGLIDGDGWISFKSKSIGFCGNELIVTQLRDILVKKLNVYNVKAIKTEEHLWMVNWSSINDIKLIGTFIYNNKQDCYLERKFQNFLNIIHVNTEVSTDIAKQDQ